LDTPVLDITDTTDTVVTMVIRAMDTLLGKMATLRAIALRHQRKVSLGPLGSFRAFSVHLL